MDKTPLVSIIIPVYNVQEFLPECLDSVAKQTYLNLEVLLIDDGSTDQSGSICDAYHEKDGRFIVYHLKNGGASVARNFALDHAKGEYISCVDSDDIIEPNMISALYNAIQENNADLSFCSSDEFGKKEVLQKTPVVGVLNRKELQKTSLNTNTVLWNKLYKRELFDGIRMPVGRLSQDVFIMPRIFERVDKAVAIPDVLYHYRSWTGSSVGTLHAKWMLDEAYAQLSKIEFYLDHNYLDLAKATWAVLDGLFKRKRVVIKANNPEERKTLRKYDAFVWDAYKKYADIFGAKNLKNTLCYRFPSPYLRLQKLYGRLLHYMAAKNAL